MPRKGNGNGPVTKKQDVSSHSEVRSATHKLRLPKTASPEPTVKDSIAKDDIGGPQVIQKGPDNATQPLLDPAMVEESVQPMRGKTFTAADNNGEPLNDTDTIEESFDANGVVTPDLMTNPSSSPSTPQRVQESQSSVISQSDGHSNDTSSTDMSSWRYNMSPRLARRNSCSQVLPITFDLQMPQPKTRVRPLTPTLVAQLREDHTSPRHHAAVGDWADDSTVDLQSPITMHHSLAATRCEITMMKRQLQNQQRLMDSVIESREMELDRVHNDHACELDKGRNASRHEVSKVEKQLQTVIASRDDAFKSRVRLEEQLSITQGELEVKAKELKRTKDERTRSHQHVQVAPQVKEVQSQTKGFGMKSASPAYNARMKDTAKAEQSEMVAKLNSQLEDQIAETKRAKARGDGLLKERDEARSKQNSLCEEISALTLKWEDEHTKVGQLRYHLQDDPAKTEALDNQLGLKDEAYQALQKKYGDTLAENAELQSRTSHIQETADSKVTSLEKKLDREHEMMLDIARSRDAYIKSHDNVLRLCKGRIINQKWVAEADGQMKIASDQIRVLNIHLRTSKHRETQLTKEVLLEKSKVESAQQATREKIDRISELECECRLKGRELERLQIQAQEHDHLIASKDAEIQFTNNNARGEIDKMSATLMTVMDKGAMVLLREKEQDLDELHNVLSQNSQTMFELEQQISILQETHFWDTNVAQIANETHEANTSRMVAAEEQVAQLIKQLSNGEVPTNEGLWEQWRQCDAARIEIRQAFEETTGRLEKCKALGMDFCAYFDMLSATFDLKLVPGGELHDHHERLFRRATNILQLSDAEDQCPVAIHPKPIGDIDESSESTGSPQLTGKERSTTPLGSPIQQSTNEAQLADESPIARSKGVIAEKEKELGIFQREDGTLDIELEFPPLEAQQLVFLASGGSAKEIIDQELQRSVVCLRKDKQDRLRRALGISPGPKDTIKADAHGQNVDAAKVTPRSDCERLAVPVLRNGAVDANVTPLLPPSAADAKDKVVRNSEMPAQALFNQGNAANNAEITPRPPPGLVGTQDTMKRNLEQLHRIAPAPSTEPLHTHEFPQYSPRLNGIEAAMQSNLEKLVANRSYKIVKRTVTDENHVSQNGDSRPSSTAGNISPISADFLWDSPNYDIDAWNARTQAQIEKERDSSPLDPSLVYTDSDPDVQAAGLTNDTTPDNVTNSGDDDQPEDPEADIHAWFAKYQNASRTPQLEPVVTAADASAEDASALVSGQSSEGLDGQLNEELEQVYLGSDGPIDAGNLDTSNDRRLAWYRLPIIAVEQVLGPGEVWDDEDDVEIIC